MDFDELVRLFKSQPLDEIPAGIYPGDRPPPAHPSAAWTKIHEMLINLDLRSIARSPHEITIFVKITGADLLSGRYWYFDYRSAPPANLVPSLWDAWPYTPDGYFYMRLDGDWYASVYEDAE